MAEVATNVLHNVGNVLNSANISATLVVEKVKMSKVSNLSRVVTLLGQHTHDLGEFVTRDPKGKHLPAFLAHLSEDLTAEQAAIVTELDSLRRNIEHIKEIVATQQSYASFGGVKERSLSRHHVEVIREFQNVPPTNVEQHKILQILVNLLRNANYACDEAGRADKRITVRVANGDGLVKISVIRIAFAMALELRKHRVASLALTPGFLRSERVLEHFKVTEANWKDVGKKAKTSKD